MVACPYDQLFIDPNTHTAEKCNFCANRVENELLPACVSVCPTECRIFGDLDDPDSEVARIVREEAIGVRKPEKRTGPNVFYVGADDSVLRPEASVRPLYYKEGQVHLRPLGAPAPDDDHPGDARVDYDVPHEKPWGTDMVLYLFMKAISTGVMLVAALLWLRNTGGPLVKYAAPVISIAFISLTAVVLIADLKRPERFLYILTKSNWRSWMVWGAWFLTVHGALSAVWLLLAWLGRDDWLTISSWPVIVTAILATSYTGFLFAQGLARDLWQGPYAAIDLVAQSGAAGSAALLLATFVGIDQAAARPVLSIMLGGSLVVHTGVLLVEQVIARSPTRHHRMAVDTIRRGPLAPLFWGVVIAAGSLIPISLLFGGMWIGAAGVALAALLALAGSAAWEYIWVEAGQSVPLS